MRRDGNPLATDTRRQAVLYARVSSKDQERGGFSIQAQQQLLRAYARQRGFEIAEAFIDVETAGKAGRANFGAMLRYVRRHPRCRAILVEKTDRLYRNIKDWVALEELGLDVHLVKEGVVLSDESMSAEKFVHGIKVLVAKNYIDNLSEETKKGLLEKARQGLWPSRAPLGYQNIVRRDGKHVIEPDAERAPIIAKVFEWYATGEFPLTALTTKARQAGLTYRKSKRPLGRSRIHKLLHDPIYMGDFIWDGQRYEGSHEPIVSRETWGDVQSVLTGRAPRRRPRQERGSGHAFAGLVSCGACADDGRHFMLIARRTRRVTSTTAASAASGTSAPSTCASRTSPPRTRVRSGVSRCPRRYSSCSWPRCTASRPTARTNDPASSTASEPSETTSRRASTSRTKIVSPAASTSRTSKSEQSAGGRESLSWNARSSTPSRQARTTAAQNSNSGNRPNSFGNRRIRCFAGS